MKSQSAGLLMYRLVAGRLEMLLVHPGGPMWTGKDNGAWGIPKGELDKNEDPLQAAVREFREETGLQPAEPFIELGSVTLKSGKIVHAWAFCGNCDPANIKSNLFTMEWPPRSGKTHAFPEIDKAGFFSIAEAEVKMNPAQTELLRRLQQRIDHPHVR